MAGTVVSVGQVEANVDAGANATAADVERARKASAAARRPVQRGVKWVADRLVALVALVLLSPVLLVLSLWVLKDAGRPVFFVQRRVGKRGVPFRMLKFRSMVNDAVAVGQQLGVTDDPHGVIKDDPRITRSGRFLRRTSLDELPQLLNVLVGSMSLVGPRPDIPEQVRNYSLHDRRRLEVLPGITGYSQVYGRDEIEWPERIAQDIEYIDHWSLWIDARLIAQTFKQIGRDEPDPVLDTHNIEAAAAQGEPPRPPHDPDWAERAQEAADGRHWSDIDE